MTFLGANRLSTQTSRRPPFPSVTKADRVQFIQQRLEELYPETPVPLDHRDPFTLLIAVLLSAQCTDLRVNEVTPALFKKGPTPQKMARLPVDEILEIVRPCGLGPHLKRLFPKDRWNKLHLQIIFYGREFCTARGCDGTVCEICRTCFPERKHPKKNRKA